MMLNSVDFSGRPFHFIGIGGIGMSALAYVVAKRKLPVSGSDIRLSHITERLQELGTHIFWSQEASNLDFFQTRHEANCEVPAVASSVTTCSSGAIPDGQRSRSHYLKSRADVLLPQVICSTAINPANAEYKAALELGCPIFHRSDLLAALIQDYRSVAVAGTHGKTTTSSMVGYVLLQSGLDPTIVVGGEVKAWEGNARVGQGPYLVAEADESDGSLVKLAPEIGVVTNIELDHPDHYANLDEVVQTFQTFAQRCHTLIGCIDCTTVRDRLQPTISYSLHLTSGADYTVDQVAYGPDGTKAQVWERGQLLGQLQLKLLGQHNLSNALAVVAVGRLLGLEFAAIATALATFEGARRRFEYRGEYNDILFIDDYAHHPSEVQATLTAARLQASLRPVPRRVVAIFQPHRYSRIQAFLPEFACSFGDADLVVLSDIYSAGEVKPAEISGELVAAQVRQHHSQVYYQPTLPDMSQFLNKILRPGDLALFLSAGNLNQLIPEVMAYQQTVEQSSLATPQQP